MIQLPRILAFASMLSIASCGLLLHAQETLTSASVTGRVVDPSGAAIPKVNSAAVAIATNQKYTVVKDQQGRFRVPYLPVGEYTLTAQAPSSVTTARKVQLTLGGAFDLTVPLRLGSSSTTHSVTADAPVLEEDRSQVFETVQQNEVSNLPYNGRNYLDLALLTPGVSLTNTASVQTFAESYGTAVTRIPNLQGRRELPL